MNKRGDSIISDFMGYIFLIIFAAIFYALIRNIDTKDQTNVIGEIDVNNARTNLLFVLREPITLDGKRYMISDLLVEAEFDDRKWSIVSSLIKVELDQIYTHWQLDIDYPNFENDFQYRIKGSNIGKSDPIGSKISPIIVYIPDYLDQTIKLELYTW